MPAGSGLGAADNGTEPAAVTTVTTVTTRTAVMSVVEILAVIRVIGFVIFKQVRGEELRGKRAVVLPTVLTVIGYTDLHGNGGAHLSHADTAWLIVGTAGSALIGLAFGAISRPEERGGYLWAELPLKGLWLWGTLLGYPLVLVVGVLLGRDRASYRVRADQATADAARTVASPAAPGGCARRAGPARAGGP